MRQIFTPEQIEADKQHTEAFAQQHAEQWQGCVECKESHHVSGFCKKCGRCFFKAKYTEQTDYGTFVTCHCGEVDLWD